MARRSGSPLAVHRAPAAETFLNPPLSPNLPFTCSSSFDMSPRSPAQSASSGSRHRTTPESSLSKGEARRFTSARASWPSNDPPVLPSPFAKPTSTVVQRKNSSFSTLIRRLTGEDRAAAANRANVVAAVEVSQDKRRKSVIGLEGTRDGVRNSFVSSHIKPRRRPSTAPPEHTRSSHSPMSLAPAPRASLARFPSRNPALEHDALASSSHLETSDGVRIKLPLPFPSPPRSPPSSTFPTPPPSERQAAFSDEYSPSRASPITASLSPGTRHSGLRPRTPQTFDFRELAPDWLSPVLSTHSSPYIVSPAGVRMPYPLVFTSARPRSFPTPSPRRLSPDDRMVEDKMDVDISDDPEAVLPPSPTTMLVEYLPPAMSAPPALPSLTAPTPPPLLSDSSHTFSDDSFSNFVFPHLPDLSPFPNPMRRSSSCSSYFLPDEDPCAATTPSTLELSHSPLGSSLSMVAGDIFSEAFGETAGAARRPSTLGKQDEVEGIEHAA